ncbi:hypothetical protein D1007_01249 [Hordeum vulgare]|nr:hypothetical protein D1007_01249 [Hordeum vulgare]
MYGSRFLRPCANRQGSASATFSTEALPLHQPLVATGINALVREEHSNWKSGLTLQLHSRNFVPEEQGRQKSHRSIVLARLGRNTLAADAISRTHLNPTNTMQIFEVSGKRPLSRRHGLDCLAALYGGRQQQARDAVEAASEVGGDG